MKRFEARKQNLINATNRLKEALNEKENDLMIDAVLHRYEFTFELAWKTIKDYLEYNGYSDNIASPRAIIQLAYQAKVINNGDTWINMMLDRNALSHLYDEEKLREIYENVKNIYLNELNELKEFLERNI